MLDYDDVPSLLPAPSATNELSTIPGFVDASAIKHVPVARLARCIHLRGKSRLPAALRPSQLREGMAPRHRQSQRDLRLLRRHPAGARRPDLGAASRARPEQHGHHARQRALWLIRGPQ